jgi:hypothetical protein
MRYGSISDLATKEEFDYVPEVPSEARASLD